MKYAAIYADENLIDSSWHDTPEAVWEELIANTGATKEVLEASHYVESFTQKEIDDLPDIDL